MAKKEIVLFAPQDLVPEFSKKAMNAYAFAFKNAGIELVDDDDIADFVSRRNSVDGWRELDELRAFFEKAAASIKSLEKHTFNVGSSDELPNTKELSVSWDKQTCTYEWMEDVGQVAVVNDLIKKDMVSVEQLLCTMSVSQISKASGIEQDKLMELYPQYICAKKSERKLRIK